MPKTMTRDFEDFEKKKPEYKRLLVEITNGLMQLNKVICGTHEQRNQLLQECYGLTGRELHTREEWHEKGCVIRERENGYVFWDFSDVQLLYSDDQVIKLQLELW